MRLYLLFISTACLLLYADDKYLDNHSCSECHEKIYEEYQGSAHARSYFNDELHQTIADKVSTKTYQCAACHMPMANNLDALLTGEARPDKTNKTHTDAISCYFCHTIAYVKSAHQHNINIKARQAENFKPTLYGRLDNPEDSDKHSSSNNPIYGQKVCLGCHSHKRNDHNVTVFRAMEEGQDSIGCIKCHMPELEGGAEKMDKRARGHHASHHFLGIHDKEFRATGMDITISTDGNNTIAIKLTNKMEHPLIIQPARVKYLEVKVLRNDQTVWQNYKENPDEDAQGFFEYRFKDKEGNKIIIPDQAHKSEINNLGAKESKILTYKGAALQKGDSIHATMFVRFAKADCLSVVELKDPLYKEAHILKKVTYIVP